MKRTMLTLLLLVAIGGTAAASEQPTRTIPPATIIMEFPVALGEMERPAVEFNHKAHTEVLEPLGCETCHRLDEQGEFSPRLASTFEIDTREDLVDAYHRACVGCHRERDAGGLVAGPVTCGECHVRRAPGVSERVVMAFDYSLHARHSKALDDKCESCHHVYDEVTEKLTYVKGKEDGCSACHGAVDQGRTLSLANASHQACISCHLRRTRLEQETGPSLCVGCHDAENRESIEVLAEVPRLMRGQKDAMWVSAPSSNSAAVAFNHLAHEQRSSFCSDCHHRSVRPCDDCHTQMGALEGAGVTTEQAYHQDSSTFSCVGCHVAFTADRPGCLGCHETASMALAENNCVRCHNGPPPGSPLLESPPYPAVVLFEPLPAPSDEFPETVVIDLLVDRYEASNLPHAKIVNALATGTSESALAITFHGGSATLCSGCHHHTPVGVRPPPCRSCHGEAAGATTDRPDLKVAYHRQCIGCHQRMGVAKQGCTDCHASKEDQS